VGRTEVKSLEFVLWAFRGGLQYHAQVRGLLPVLLLGLAACASSPLRTVPRVVDGRVESGPAVSPYAYAHFIEGEVEATKGRHDEAAMAFENANAAPPSDVLLLARLAEEYEISGATRRADRTLSAARRGYPNSARVSMAEGRIARNRDDLDAAFDAFHRANAQDPTWSEPILAIANTLASRGHPRRASALLFEYLMTAPEPQSGDARAALIAFARRNADALTLSRALELEPGLSKETRARKAGLLALRSGQPALAARLLESGLGDERNVQLWLQALVESGEQQRATAFLASADAARMTEVEDRADSLIRLHEGDRALELLAAAERSPRVQYARGVAFLARGDYLRAADTLADVPMGAASFEASRVALSECTTARGRPGAAAVALSSTPYSSLAVRRKLARIYIAEGELKAALRLFDPKRAEERAELALVFERAGRFEEAAAYYAAVKVTSSTSPRLRARATAEQLASRNLGRSAIAILEHWASTAPEDLHSRVRLVELLIAEGRGAEAEAIGNRALPFVDDPILRAHLDVLLRASEQSAR
jgi:thioredoxin-like negative regulator of GroEL